MTELKMKSNLKELLKVQGASNETIKLVEDYYNTMFEAVVNETQQEEQVQKTNSNSSKSFRDLAQEARLIK